VQHTVPLNSPIQMHLPRFLNMSNKILPPRRFPQLQEASRHRICQVTFKISDQVSTSLQVSSTSRSFAAYRAIESARPDALFRDPLAEYLAGEVAIGKQRAQIAAGGNPGARFAVRTKYFDNALVVAIDRIKSAVPNAKVQVSLHSHLRHDSQKHLGSQHGCTFPVLP
jgi:hypothetical protein